MHLHHLTHNFITYKKGTNKSKKGFYIKTMQVGLVKKKKLLKQDD